MTTVAVTYGQKAGNQSLGPFPGDLPVETSFGDRWFRGVSDDVVLFLHDLEPFSRHAFRART